MVPAAHPSRRQRAVPCLTQSLLPMSGLGLLLLAACGAPGPAGCGAREVTLRNASALPIEQAYGGDGTPGGWGAELLGPTDLAPGARRTLRLPARAQAVRLVWANGRAAELHGVDLCGVASLTLTDQVLRPE